MSKNINLDAWLDDMEDFLDNHADADFDGESYRPNRAMQLYTQLVEIRAELAKLAEGD